MAKFAINKGVPGASFYPEIEANRYKKDGDFILFIDDENEVVDCISESLIRRIQLVDAGVTSNQA
jgi:hypothetical protein